MAALSRPLEVAHLISGDLWAGAESATYHLLRSLARRDELRVRAVLLNPGLLAERLLAAGIPTAVVAEREHSFAQLARRVRGELRGADLVHAHRYKENLLAALGGVPWLSTRHGRPERQQGAAALRSRAYAAIDRLCLGLGARRVIAVSREVEAWVAQRIGRRRTVHCWNGIEDPAQSVAAPRWSERPMRVGTLGRLYPVKGYELAIAAVALCPELELELVGDGPERAQLEQQIQASGAAARIHLIGHDPDPLPRLASWRALLVTSHHEGNPINALEALALGTPVLSADLGGVRELLGGRGGRLQDSRDPRAWARALRELAADRAAGEPLSREARGRFLECFTADAAAARVAAIYAQIAAELALPRPALEPPAAQRRVTGS